jgi:site-specific DNA-methyltransferase (adenine-specific)
MEAMEITIDNFNYSNNKDYIICGDAEYVMKEFVKDESVHLIITSPPYNVGIDYDEHNDNLDYASYLSSLFKVWEQCYRVLVKGGRIAINVPNISIEKKYYSLTSDIVKQMEKIGFIMRGDILWYKQVCSSRTAWGSWQSPSNPNIIQPYEFVLVFSKETKKLEGNKENIDITKEEFIEYSNGFWHITPETQNKTSHPCPFPEELVYRLIKFYSYKGNVVLDPFGGSGTTALVAKKTERQYISIDKSKKYTEITEKRVDTIQTFRPNQFIKNIKNTKKYHKLF